jgi:hypothetical protein
MIVWFDPAQKLPEDGQECLLMPPGHDGLLTSPVFGPIPWNAREQLWIDVFRDPAAGALIRPDQVGCWTDWEAIAPDRQ